MGEKKQTKTRTKTKSKNPTPKCLEGKQKRFTSEYQPSGEAKSAGIRRAKARNLVLNTILKEVTESMVDIKVKGETMSVPALEALIKKLVTNATKDDKTLIRVMNMLLEYESRNTVVEQRQEEFERRNGNTEDSDFNDSFIKALNAETSDIWKD
jgi:hypothetical protein